jgi:hypothetical protein
MKNLSEILILVLLCLFCSATTCTEGDTSGPSGEAQQVSSYIDSIGLALGSEEPGEDFLRSGEVAAIRNLTDFTDYLNIASDQSLDTAFRRQAAALAIRLFKPPPTATGSFCHSAAFSGSLHQLASACLNNNINFKLFISDPQIIKPLTFRNDSLYLGKIRFTLQLKFNTADSTAPGLDEVHDIDLLLSLRYKTFGDRKLRLWAPFFGDIN